MSGPGYESPDVGRYARDFSQHPALAEGILARLPPVEVEPERVIRCSPENADRAICRALARAVVDGNLWRLEVTK